MAINSRNGNTLLETGFFPPCRTATSGSNIVLSGLQTLGGVVLLSGDRVLVKNQTDPKQNGIYAASTGNWVRTTDAASNTQFFDGMAVIVAQGTVAGTIWLCTTTDDPVVIGTSLITFALQAQGTIAASPQLFDSRALAAAAAIPASINFVRTAGYAGVGDLGAALYKKAGGSTLGGFQSADGQWWAVAETVLNPYMFGALGAGAGDDTAAVQNTINALPRGVTGEVFLPPGHFLIPGGLTLAGKVILRGAGQGATILDVNHADVVALAISGDGNTVRDCTIYGKGLNGDTGALGAIHSAVTVDGTDHVLRDLTVWGGAFAIQITATDYRLDNVYASLGYGTANVAVTGPGRFADCKFDHGPTGVGVTTAQPYPAWQAGHAYTAGQVAIVGGYAIQVTAPGTSGGSAPTVANYGVNIPDGGATWLLLAPSSYTGLLFGTAPGENTVTHTDLSGPGYTNSVSFAATATGNGPNTLILDDCVCSAGIAISGANGTWVDIVDNEFSATIAVNASYGGRLRISGNNALGTAANISIGGGVSNFIITENDLAGGTITTAGASDFYFIVNNLRVTVSDSASGVNKTISPNH